MQNSEYAFQMPESLIVIYYDNNRACAHASAHAQNNCAKIEVFGGSATTDLHL